MNIKNKKMFRENVSFLQNHQTIFIIMFQLLPNRMKLETVTDFYKYLA